MILLVDFEMFGQVADPFAQERDLNFRRTRVGLVDPVLLYNGFLFLSRKCQLLFSS
jgi:hypothetical protein